MGIPVDAIGDDLAFESVAGWDSLRHISLVAGLEQGFDVELTFDEILGMRTVGDARSLLRARGRLSE